MREYDVYTEEKIISKWCKNIENWYKVMLINNVTR